MPVLLAVQIQTEMMGDIHHYAWRARHRNQTVYINKRDSERFGDWTSQQCAVRHSLTHSFTHSLVCSLICLLTHCLTQPLSHSLTHGLTHSIEHSVHCFTLSVSFSLSHSLTYSLTHSLNDSLIHLLTHSLTHSLNDSLTHSLSHFRQNFQSTDLCVTCVQTEDCVEAHTNVDVVVNVNEFRALLKDRLPHVWAGKSVSEAAVPWPEV